MSGQREWLAEVADVADELGYMIARVAPSSIKLVPAHDAWPQLPVGEIVIEGRVSPDTLRRVLKAPGEAEHP